MPTAAKAKPTSSSRKASAAEHSGTSPLDQQELDLMDAYWRAANYLSVGQIYLKDNPLLERPLTLDDVKPRLLGHWGTTPGLNFLYLHLNRLIRDRTPTHATSSAPVTAARHRGQHLSRRLLHRDLSAHRAEQRRHQAPLPPILLALRNPQPRCAEDPGSIHEGGELGYSLVHAYGAAFDNPDLIVACVVGDGEAETGPPPPAGTPTNSSIPPPTAPSCPSCISTATRSPIPPSWRAFPRTSSKSSSRATATSPLPRRRRSRRHAPAGMAAILDTIFDRIRRIQKARARKKRRHTSPLAHAHPAHPQGLDRPEECRRQAGRRYLARAPGPLERSPRKARPPQAARRVDAQLQTRRALRRARLLCVESISAVAPQGPRRMGMNPHANGGLLLQPLACPTSATSPSRSSTRRATENSATRILGNMLHDVMEPQSRHARTSASSAPTKPPPTACRPSTRSPARRWDARVLPVDENLSADGRVMEML